MYTRKEQDNIAAIERRIAVLDLRFKANPHFTFDGRELRALRWALSEIEAARGTLPEWAESDSSHSAKSSARKVDRDSDVMIGDRRENPCLLK